jgi:hypothetical protein
MRKFNLSLDDFSPHKKSGLNFESIYWCNKLIEKWPSIKIDLFTPAAYCRIGEDPCYLTKHPAWVNEVNALPNNYRINMHGLFHRRTDGKHPDSNNDEFQFLKGEWAHAYINTMITEFNNSGLKYHKVFRPPGWKISFSSVRALMAKGFIIAGDEAHYQKFKDIKNLKWISYNYDMVGKIPTKSPLIAYGHTSNWTNNYMDETRFNLLSNILDNSKFDFKFIEELL